MNSMVRWGGRQAGRGLVLAFSLMMVMTTPVGAEGKAEYNGHQAEVMHVVTRAYNDILGREPDPEGLATYTDLLGGGVHDEAWLRKTLRRSPEGRQPRQRMRNALRMHIIYLWIWSALAFLFWAFGDVLCRRLLCRPADGNDGLDGVQKLWMGFGFSVCVLQFWSLFLPVDVVCLMFFGMLGGGALLDKVRTGWRWRSNERFGGDDGSSPPVGKGMKVTGWAFFAVALACFFMIAVAGSAHPFIRAYDTLLYHLNWVRWHNTFPVVPGLANLHIRLGTNSAWLLFGALVDNAVLDGRSAWILPGFCGLLFGGYLLFTVFVSVRAGMCTRLMALLLLPYAGRQLLVIWPNLYSDDPAQFVLAVCLIECIRMAERGKAGMAGVTLCVVTGYLSFVIKPIAAPTVVVITVGLLCWLLWSVCAGSVTWRRAMVALAPMLLIVGWVLRNAVLSGWLLYPAAVAPLPVDWAVPRQAADQSHAAMLQSVSGQKDIIQAWARRRGASRYQEALNAPLSAWFPDWFAERRNTVELRGLLPIGGIGLLVGLPLVFHYRRPLFWWSFILSLIMTVQLMFWFASAPDLRFGSGLFWMWGAWGMALPLSLWQGWDVGRRLAYSAAALLVLAQGAVQAGRAVDLIKGSPWILGRAVSLPVRSVTLENGQRPPLQVYVPSAGDRVGDSELPATPYPSHRLQSRWPGRLEQGFRAGGTGPSRQDGPGGMPCFDRHRRVLSKVL